VKALDTTDVQFTELPSKPLSQVALRSPAERTHRIRFCQDCASIRDGTLWVATTLGLEAFDPRTGKTSRRVTLRGPSGASLALDGNKVSIIEDHAGVLWISIPGQQECGLASFDPRSDVQSAYSLGDGPSDTGFAIIEDEDQTLWFANWRQGIVRLGRDRKRAMLYRNNPNNFNSLSAGGVMTLLQDRDHRDRKPVRAGSIRPENGAGHSLFGQTRLEPLDFQDRACNR
jgi:ligand-binding sensor domain-containing protein